MLEPPDQLEHQHAEDHSDLAATNNRNTCHRRQVCRLLRSGLLIISPFLFWLVVSHITTKPMAELYAIVQAGIVTVVLLNALVSWESLRIEHFVLRLTFALLFITGGLLLAIELASKGYRPSESAYIHHLLRVHLASTAEILLAAALFMMGIRSERALHWRVPRSNIALWIAGIPLALATLYLTSILQTWSAAIFPWQHAVAALMATALLGLYGGAILVTWSGAHRKPNPNATDYMLAIILLTAGELIQIFASISGRNQLILLTHFYRLMGFAWVLRYTFMVGFREPHQRLTESEAQFRTLFEKNSEVILLLDPESGKILDCNQAAATFYGYSRPELQNLHIWDINTLPRAMIEERIKHVTSGSKAHFHFQHRLKNGDIRDVDAYSVALNLAGRTVIYDVIRDDTERKEALADLSLFQQAIEASANGIIITDATPSDTPIVYVNPAFEKLTGYTLNEVRGKNPRLLQGVTRDRMGRDDVRRAISEGRSVHTILKNYRKDATAYWCEVSISPVRNAHGDITHWLGIQNDITARLAAEEKLEHLAYYDSLTGAPNRQLTLVQLEHDIAAANRSGNYGALAFLDLDHFKEVNDTQGHEAGDSLLIMMVERVRTILRQTDTLGRIGGDEFVIVLPDLSPDRQRAANELELILQRIIQLLSEPIKVGHAEYAITASMGVTLFPQENTTAPELITQADIAMYRAKEAGRNTICFFEPAMQERIKERVAMVQDLRIALSNGDFRIFLQPQVDQTRSIIGAEALIRWQSREGGLIAPAKFIPAAEDTGLIVPMGEFMLREACHILRRLQRADIRFRISVNVSLRQFQMTDFAQRIIAIVKSSEIDPRSLTIEITESVLMRNAKDAVEKMKEINQLGIGFSIDDFGTGYSSLGYLKNLPLNELKIDRSFICDIATNPNDAALVEAILAIAHHHQLQVVAEGIETLEQFESLKERACPLFQGYFFGRPVPAEELIMPLLSANSQKFTTSDDTMLNTRPHTSPRFQEDSLEIL